LPAELDFFKYAQGGSKRKEKTPADDSRTSKKRKPSPTEDEDEDMQSPPPDAREDLAPSVKHRVTAKGKDVPTAADTFDAMAERYELSPLLRRNLDSSGYTHPTAIQMHGVPIMLEVSSWLLPVINI
jgi:ATP-dependent RNA helicase DDX52/ROK1